MVLLATTAPSSVAQTLDVDPLFAGGVVGFEVHNAGEFREYLKKFIRNDIFRQEAGKRAFEVVRENAGATEKTVREIMGFLK